MMTWARYAIRAISIAALLVGAGCGGAGGGGLFGKSPGNVVKAAYMAGNAGQYTEAEKYFSSAALNIMKDERVVLAGGMKGMWDHLTRGGTIDRFEILSEEVRGEGAKVFFRIHFKDGDTDNGDETLIKENGEWKMTIG